MTNIINDKIYIGQTRNSIHQRFLQHIQEAKNGTTYLCRAIRKYGGENFIIDVIEECDNDRLNEKEIYWIDYYDSMDHEIGYNLCIGGQGSSTITKEMINDIHELWEIGCTVKEICEQLNLSTKPVTNILRQRDDYSLEEARGRPHRVPVKQYDFNGEYIATFNSCIDAEKATGISAGTISSCCSNPECKRSAGGFQWRYADDNPPGIYNYTTKSVNQYDLQGNYIATYSSINEAADSTNILASSITDACKKNNYTAGGYQWTYADDDPPGVSDMYRRKIEQYDLDGNYVATYDSYKHVIDVLNVNVSCLSQALSGKTKSAFGYQWINEGDSPPGKYSKNYSTRAIKQFDLDGNFIKEFSSITEASEATGISLRCIQGCCAGKQKTSGGSVWRYAS